jgi:low affinity Fe/Cu permease
MLVVLAPNAAVTPAAKRVVAAVVIAGAAACVGAVGAVCAYTELTNSVAISVAISVLIIFCSVLGISVRPVFFCFF